MADGARHPHRPDDRGRHGDGERGPSLIPHGLGERYPGGEWLDPVADALTRAMDALDRAKLALVAVAGAVVLLYIGAKVERHMLKSRLAVLGGAASSGDLDVSDDGRRG